MLGINDFSSCTNDVTNNYFVDDSTVYTKDESLSGLAGKINIELHKVVKWLNVSI